MTDSGTIDNTGRSSCDEYRGLTRRAFLRGSGALAAGLGATAALPGLASAGARGGGPRDVLVHVFFRGGLDGLSFCVPYGDTELYAARPNLAIAPPGAPGGALDLDGFFGLNPAAAGLTTPFQAGHLAVVHATGSPDPTRSHFDAMKAMERATPGAPLDAFGTGWLARHLNATPPVASASDGRLRAVALTDLLPSHLAGAGRVLPIPTLDDFVLGGNPATRRARARLVDGLYGNAVEPLSGAAASTFDTIELFETVDFAGYAPAGGAAYPDSTFGQQLREAAAAIRADLGIEVVSIDYGGWDHHNQEGPRDGLMASMLQDVAQSLEAFYLDLAAAPGAWIDRVTVVAMSEFGRRVAENGSLGADHGHGNMMLVMGGHVNGGQVLASWPGLHPDLLDQGDLAITTDYRDVLSEVLVDRLGTGDLAAVLPNYAPPAIPLGVTS